MDFSRFGVIETKPLSRIKKLSGANLHRNWVSIPHITQHDEADITAIRNLSGCSGTPGNVRNRDPVAMQIGTGKFLDARERLGFDDAELGKIDDRHG